MDSWTIQSKYPGGKGKRLDLQRGGCGPKPQKRKVEVLRVRCIRFYQAEMRQTGKPHPDRVPKKEHTKKWGTTDGQKGLRALVPECERKRVGEVEMREGNIKEERGG